jgi:hypothetical protein
MCYLLYPVCTVVPEPNKPLKPTACKTRGALAVALGVIRRQVRYPGGARTLPDRGATRAPQ